MVINVKPLSDLIFLIFDGHTLVGTTYDKELANEARSEGLQIKLTPIEIDSNEILSKILLKPSKPKAVKSELKFLKEQEALESKVRKLECEKDELKMDLKRKTNMESLLKSIIVDYKKVLTKLDDSYKETLKTKLNFEDEGDLRKHYFGMREVMKEQTLFAQKTIRNTEIKLELKNSMKQNKH